MKTPERPGGMHPDAWAAYLRTGLPAGRIRGTVGAATELRVGDLGGAAARAVGAALAAQGFVVARGRVDINLLILWPGCAMPAAQRALVREHLRVLETDLKSGPGLASGAAARWPWQPAPGVAWARMRAAFLAHNPSEGL